jgi:hypothetical protein
MLLVPFTALLVSCSSDSQLSVPAQALLQPRNEELRSSAASNGKIRSWVSDLRKVRPLIYLSDFGANTVTIFDRRGSIHGQIAGLSNPAGLFVDRKRNLWVANFFGHNILEFVRGGTSPINTLNDPLGYPNDVTICPNGTTYVSDVSEYGGNNGIIQVYAPGTTDPESTLQWADVNHWFYITCDAQNNVFATGNSITTDQGAVIGFPGGSSSSAYDLGITLSGARGIKADKTGNLVVADTGGHTISEYTEAGSSTGRSVNTGTGDITDIDLFGSNRVVGGADASRYELDAVTLTFPGGVLRRTYRAPGGVQPMGFAIDPAQKL